MTKVEKYIQSLINSDEQFYPIEISSELTLQDFNLDHYYTIDIIKNKILGFKINHDKTLITYIVIKNNIEKSFSSFKKALLYYNN